MKKFTFILILLAAVLFSGCVAYDYGVVAPVPARAVVVYPGGYYYSRPYYRPTPPPPPPHHHHHHHR